MCSVLCSMLSSNELKYYYTTTHLKINKKLQLLDINIVRGSYTIFIYIHVIHIGKCCNI